MSSHKIVQGDSSSPQKKRNLKKLIAEDSSPTKIARGTKPVDMLQSMIDAKRMQKNIDIT
jgi:hypothetical protein